MIRLIAVAFALVVATSVQAMPVAPLHQQEGMTTEFAWHAALVGYELMVSAWPEPLDVMSVGPSAGARCGVQGTFASVGFIETPPLLEAC